VRGFEQCWTHRYFPTSTDVFAGLSGYLGDWTDLSDDPDRRQWADMFHPDTRPREQGEIRRNVWRIYVCRGSATSDEFMVLPADCTMTADRAEIPALVRRIIANDRT